MSDGWYLYIRLSKSVYENIEWLIFDKLISEDIIWLVYMLSIDYMNDTIGVESDEI